MEEAMENSKAVRINMSAGVFQAPSQTPITCCDLSYWKTVFFSSHLWNGKSNTDLAWVWGSRSYLEMLAHEVKVEPSLLSLFLVTKSDNVIVLIV